MDFQGLITPCGQVVLHPSRITAVAEPGERPARTYPKESRPAAWRGRCKCSILCFDDGALGGPQLQMRFSEFTITP
jgi:hypothetical protein